MHGAGRQTKKCGKILSLGIPNMNLVARGLRFLEVPHVTAMAGDGCGLFRASSRRNEDKVSDL